MGSPRTITDESGTVIKAIEYDSFGNVIADSNESFEIPFGFAGGLKDSDTRLLRFGYRDYDPQIGRWTARDPIGFAGGDTNLYGYVLVNVVSGLDLNGLAYFAKRPLGGVPESIAKGIGTNSLDDRMNTELVHEQVFFEDGQSPSDLGFFGDNGSINEPGVVRPDDPGQLNDYWKSDKKHYDDALMREAADNVGEGNYCLIGSNCQDWADKLRFEYERLKKERNKKCLK